MSEQSMVEQRSAASGSSQSFSESVRFLLKYARLHKGKLLTALLTALPIAAAGMGVAWVVKGLVEELAETPDISALTTFLLLGVGIVFAKGVLEIVNRQIMTLTHARIVQAMRLELFDAIQSRSLGVHLQTRTGETANLLGNDVQFAAGGVVELYECIWKHPAVLLCGLGVMFYLSPVLSLAALGIIPVMALLAMKTARACRKQERLYMERSAGMMGMMVESLGNIREVKAFNNEDRQRKVLEKESDALISVLRRTVFLKSLVGPVAELCGILALGAMALLAYRQISTGQATVGAVAGCLAASLTLKKSVRALSGCFVNVQRSFAAIQRIQWIAGQTAEATGTHRLEAPIERITLRNLGFSFDGRTNILQGMSAAFGKGECVAVCGSSGSGKSTLLDLIAGFYPTNEGSIAINDMALSELDVNWWRQQVAIVSQNPQLFEGTIRENVLFGYEDATDADLSRALERSGCTALVERLSDGLDTTVGERGCRLSGGERKRIALARALVRPISVLLLDEATNELEARVERQILDDVRRLKDDLVVICVSHRSTILDICDRAYRLGSRRLQEVTVEDAKTMMSPDADKNGSVEPLAAQPEGA